ncbi:ArsR/SmtB family transcription factor [Virgibacillus salexigens]|uniref:Transcriptional regulator n=1 Tax=Virgibacillus kapii TaxID=1638645 RepID=A0ABQ2DI18_9BACI|nr:winged helix-turn-helix domain-containing protein [Virgibacillus kapii]GGJ58830.1 transcriptional regulator [Virgibacillus kapii]
MSVNPNVAKVASLLSEPSRAMILTSLMDGRFHTASELAYMAAIKPQTASFHLSKLVKGNLVTVEKHGRYRYYQLASREVACILESFLTISKPPEVRSLKQSSQTIALRNARTCYDHLAGRLGVALTESMVNLGYLRKGEKEFEVTSNGERFFQDFGLELADLRKERRSFSRVCLDWSERHHHLAGALGQAITSHLFELNWISRKPLSRAVTITDKGQKELKRYFNLSI